MAAELFMNEGILLPVDLWHLSHIKLLCKGGCLFVSLSICMYVCIYMCYVKVCIKWACMCVCVCECAWTPMCDANTLTLAIPSEWVFAFLRESDLLTSLDWFWVKVCFIRNQIYYTNLVWVSVCLLASSPVGHSSTRLYSQSLEGTGSWISVSSSPACFT